MNLNLCLISKETITNKITLPCKHEYEYLYLYEEIIQQRNRHKHYFKCPYCRCVYNAVIPYYELDDIKQLKNINIGKEVLNILKCDHDANDCICPANKFKTGNFCWKHYNKKVVELCSATCLNGSPCKNKRIKDGLVCNKHKSKPIKLNLCSATCLNGLPCKNKSITKPTLGIDLGIGLEIESKLFCNVHKKK